jgi:pimeloyl-ACP methyl ester carboxylesterase
MYGSLFARYGEGVGEPTVLLHGLVSTGGIFGSEYDSLTSQGPVIVPDLLGFGGSMDHERDDFGPEAHLDALDELMAELGLGDEQFSIGAHSMGSPLAMRWAARHPTRARRVVCWGAPVYPSEEAAFETIASSGMMARLFVLDTGVAQRACAMSCRHRSAAGWLTALSEPTLPVPISRAVPLHTWPAYRDSINGLVLKTDWNLLLPMVAERAEVKLIWGGRDSVGDPAYAAELVEGVVEIVADADHHLPMTHDTRCCWDMFRAST